LCVGLKIDTILVLVSVRGGTSIIFEESAALIKPSLYHTYYIRLFKTFSLIRRAIAAHRSLHLCEIR
jgi:hypothetical protein